MIAEHLPTHGTEPIDALTEIDRLGGHKDAALGGKLQHECTSKKARTTATRGSVDSGAWMHSRVPSARDSSIWGMAVGWGQKGAGGTSTKPRGRGDNAAVAS